MPEEVKINFVNFRATSMSWLFRYNIGAFHLLFSEEPENMEGDDVFDSEESEDEVEEQPQAKKKKAVRVKRRHWSKGEVVEIHKYFKSYLDAKKTPRSKAIEEAKEKSRKKGGILHRRENHLIIKKISALNHKKCST